MTRRQLFLLSATMALMATALPAAIRPQMDAKTFDTDAKTGEIVFTGNAHLQWENALLLADEIRYNPKTNIAVARGHVSLTRGPRRMLADQLVYKIEDQSFTVENMRLGEFPLYMTGVHVSGDRSKIIVDDARLFYTEPDSIAPSLKAERVYYTPGQTVSADKARIGLGTTVPISIPKFEQKLNESLLGYTDAHFGYRASLGAHVGLGLHVPVFDGVKLGGDIAYYTRRGLLAGPSGTYDLNIGTQELFGSFRSGYIHDYGDRLQDALARPIQADRGYIEWDHHQQINERITLFGQLRYWSDSDVIRDFIPDEFSRVQTPDTFIEGEYAGNNYIVSLFSRFQPNDFVRVQERLPELRFDLMPTPIGLGIYERFNASAAVLREEDIQVAGVPALNSTRFDAFYGLSRPMGAGDYFTFTPVAGGRFTYYSHAVGRDDYTRVLGEVGFDANLRTSAVYEYKNERWKIDGIRHLLTPRVSYRYIPAADKGSAYIPDIDRTIFSTYLQPLELGDQRNIDELHAINTLRIGVDNLFQTRDKKYGSRDLLMLNVAADVQFEREIGQDKVSDLHTEFAFMPADWVRFEAYNSVDPKDFGVQEFNTGIRILDSNAWSVRFSNRYLAQQIQEYVVDGRYRITEAYEAFARLDYDARETRFIERTVGLRQNLRNLWSIDYAVSFYSGRRRESSFGFALRVNLIGL
ncbi:MAG TPA: LPS assembly protein LptD [Opitutaceae bacterium]|nr:LPS assembly protein LptD [Opitutaceae bacterium]